VNTVLDSVNVELVCVTDMWLWSCQVESLLTDTHKQS